MQSSYRRLGWKRLGDPMVAIWDDADPLPAAEKVTGLQGEEKDLPDMPIWHKEALGGEATFSDAR